MTTPFHASFFFWCHTWDECGMAAQAWAACSQLAHWPPGPERGELLSACFWWLKEARVRASCEVSSGFSRPSHCMLTLCLILWCVYVTKAELGRGGGRHRGPPGMLSRELVSDCHSVTDPPPPLLYLHPHPQRHIRSAPCKTKAAAAPKGTVPPPVFNPSYISSLPPPPPPPPSSKHFWLFCFAALPRVIAQDNNHARLFSLRSPGLCMHAGLVLPYDIQAFSIKYAWTLERKINFGNVLSLFLPSLPFWMLKYASICLCVKARLHLFVLPSMP